MMETQPGRVCPPALLVQSAVVGGSVHRAYQRGQPRAPAPAAHAVKLSRSSRQRGRQAAPPRRQDSRCGPAAPRAAPSTGRVRARRRYSASASIKGANRACSPPRTAPYRLPLGLARRSATRSSAVGEHRAQQHGCQRNVLRRVVDNTQQRRKGSDMRLIKQIGGGIRKDRNARRAQRALIIGKALAAAQQDTEVLIPAGAPPSLLRTAKPVLTISAMRRAMTAVSPAVSAPSMTSISHRP